jgi:hypothetical protein
MTKGLGLYFSYIVAVNFIGEYHQPVASHWLFMIKVEAEKQYSVEL